MSDLLLPHEPAALSGDSQLLQIKTEDFAEDNVDQFPAFYYCVLVLRLVFSFEPV